MRSPTSSPLLRSVTRPFWMAFLVAGLFSLALNLLVLTSPLYMFQVFDRVLTSGHLDTLVWLTVLAAGAYAAYGALEAVRGRMLSRAGAWIDQRLGAPLIAAGIRAGTAGEPTGTQPLRDLAQLRGFLAGPAIPPLLDAPWTPVFLAVLWFMHPWLGIFALVMAALLLVVMVVGEIVTRRPVRDGEARQTRAYGLADATMRQGDMVQAMGMLPALLRRWGGEQEQALAAQQKASDRGLRLQGFTKAARLFMQTAILGLGAWLVVRGELTGGGMIASSILLGRALAPVDQLLGSWKQFVSVRDAWRRVTGLLARYPSTAEAMPLPAPKGSLSVEEMYYVPPGQEKPVLQGVSFGVEPGQVLGIIGPSAAGKSTLCRLLVGAVAPTSGNVRLDHADLSDWNRAEVGPHIGYLPQEVTLFAGTVGENIARMGEVDSEKVIQAAQAAGIHEIVLRLPQGYETRLDESGVHLSGGQRQRLGLARALYGDPKLLVLDEPNANLDGEGEAALQAAVAAAKQRGCAVILVTHRPSMLEHADLLLFLRDGIACAFGPAEEVWHRLHGNPPRAVASLVRAGSSN